MKMTIDMLAVASCQVSDCAYNVDDLCHARAITIGDGVFPGCDTQFSAPAHIHNRQQIAGVGACKVSGCRHNEDYQCAAESIAVGGEGAAIRCLTFVGR